MSATLRSISLFLVLIAVGTLTWNASAAPTPPDAPPEDELPFGALIRMGPAKSTFRRPAKSDKPALLQIAFSPDGKWLAALGFDLDLHLLDAKTGKYVRRIDVTSKLGGSAQTFAFALDSKTVAISNGMILSVPEGETVATFNAKMPNPELVTYSPDGKKIALVGSEGIALFDAKKGTNLLRKDISFRSPNAVAFTPDGKSLVVASERLTTKPFEVNSDYVIAIHDADKLKETTTLKSEPVRSVFFIGKKLATSHDDGNVRIWDLDKEKVASVYKGHEGGVPLASWDVDRKTLTTAGLDGTVRFWKSDEKEDRRIKIAEPGNVQLFALSPDGKTLAAGRSAGLIQLWDLKSESMKAIIGQQGAISSLAFSPDGKTLATGSLDRTVRLWDAATGKDQLKLFDHGDAVAALAFTPDGKDLITAAERVRVWNVKDAVETRRFGKDKVPAHPAALSPDGKMLAEAILDHGLTLWDPSAGKERHQFNEKTLGKPGGLCVAFSPNGRWIATGTDMPERGVRWSEGLVALWDADKRKLVRQFGGHPVKVAGGVKAIAFTADSNSVVYSEGKTLCLSDIATGAEVRSFEGHESVVTCFALSPDGRLLASAEKDDHVIRLWEVRTGQEIRRFRDFNQTLLSLAFSPDGKRLASGCETGTAMIWQVYAPLDAKTPFRPKFTAKELEGVWSDLIRPDSMNAHLAVAALAGAPKDSIPFLKERLKDYQSPDAKQLAKLTDAVLDELPPECDDAYRDLQDLEDAAEGAVRDALKKSPSDSARKRLQKLLDDRENSVHYTPVARRLAIHRALAVLELIGDADCIAILKQLAKGNPKDPIVREAAATLERVTR
jgi:WD40 repeat protein